MLHNYLAAALRNLVRNRLYAAINIVGLAVGFAAALLIALFVRDELSYDTWIPGHEQVYRLGATLRMPGAPTMSGPIAEDEDADTLRTDFPEIAHVARIRTQGLKLRRGGVEVQETIAFADPDFFRVLPLPALHGDLASALTEADSVVLTRRLAQKYFGRADVIGETLELDRKATLRVSAVLQDLPSRTHLSGDVWASTLNAVAPRGDPVIYLRLKAGVSRADVESRLPDWIDRYYPLSRFKWPPGTEALQAKRMRDFRQPWIQPLAEIHSKPPTELPSEMASGSGSPRLRAALAAVGGLILFVAAANFVNLMTARAGRRAVEVGVRKVSGARRRQLIVQFLGESFVAVLAALLLAGAIVALCVPAFNAFLGREISVEPWRDLSAPAIVTALVLAITLLGGVYPALVLSAYRPAVVLKSGAADSAGSMSLRKILVVAQFAVFVGLVLATLVMDRQTAFVLKGSIRTAADQILIAQAPCRDALKQQLAALDGVQALACGGGSTVGTRGDGSIEAGMNSDGRYLMFETHRVDAGLFELYGFKPLAGRFFDPRSAVSEQVVINERAVFEFGFASAEEAVGRPLVLTGGNNPEIVGVVENFALRSLQGPLRAAVFRREQGFGYNFVAVKLDSAKIGTTVPRVEEILRTIDSTQAPTTWFYDQRVQEQYRGLTRQGQAFTAFAGVAIVIAALGLFGLSAFSAEQRTKEIGIRKAMGATRAEIVRLLLWQFTKPVLWANAIAWPAAYLIMRRWLEGFAYHIDLAPWMFLAASALALAIAVLTVTGHALLVARAKPVAALRYE